MARILVIDDEGGIRETIREVLTQDDGHEVIEASNGKEGLEAVFKEKPDLIICDRKMPEMSGYEFLEKLRTEESGDHDVPFIFLTALNDHRDVKAVMHLAPTEYLTKPIEFDRLREVVAKYLGGETSES